MPWRLLIALVILVLVALFATFNLIRVDVSVGFYVFKEIPLFLALMFSFILGAVVMLPFAVRGMRRGKKADKVKKVSKEKSKGEEVPADAEDTGEQKRKRKKVR
jgi:uncharacterized integral membrane protein